jgi:hypothetical protein
VDAVVSIHILKRAIEAIMNPEVLAVLTEGPVYSFRDWPNPAVPRVSAGVYTIWQGSEFIYVGMSGRGLSTAQIAQHRETGSRHRGMHTRLASHASGVRSGDQFCVYVADRLVLPQLTPVEIETIAATRNHFDRIIKKYIHDNLTYRFSEAADGQAAAEWEDHLRLNGWRGRLPLLNAPILQP